MKLNLGCCDHIMAGWINSDIVPGPGVDIVADLRARWPWPDSSADEVRAWDLIEHLPDKIFTMNEMWRVLSPGGVARIFVPTTDGRGAFQDPTHVSYWNRNSFWYYEHGNSHRERFAVGYGVTAAFRVVYEKQTRAAHDITHLEIHLAAVK